jgi:hypothetical protein
MFEFLYQLGQLDADAWAQATGIKAAAAARRAQREAKRRRKGKRSGGGKEPKTPSQLAGGLLEVRLAGAAARLPQVAPIRQG